MKKFVLLAIIFSIALLITNVGFRKKLKFKNKQLSAVANELKIESERKIVQEQGKVTYLPSSKDISLENYEPLATLDKNKLLAGQKEMAKHKIIITGITRDNAVDLPIMIKHIEYVGEFFGDYRVILIENDSTDGTKAIIDNWQNANKKVKVISQDYRNTKRPSIKFLADVRNKYLEAIEKDIKYENFDIMMVVDMDMSYGFDVRGIMHSFSQINRWDSVCSNGISNQKGEMYDMFAFRNEEFPWKPIDNPEKYWSEVVPRGQKVYDISLDLIPVYSCFGGLGIYKIDFTKSCRYDSIQGDCEHLPFHECIKENHKGRIVMNPAQVIRYSHYQ